MVARTKKSPERSAAKPKEVAGKGGDARGLDRVREILIGSHAQEVERRFRAIEKRIDEAFARIGEEAKRLAEESEALSEEIRRRTEELARSLQRTADKLQEDKADRAAIAEVLALVAERLRREDASADRSPRAGAPAQGAEA